MDQLKVFEKNLFLAQITSASKELTQKIIGQEDAGVINVFTKNVQPDKLFSVMVRVRLL